MSNITVFCESCGKNFSKYKFTKRQCEILTLMAQGYSYFEISQKLFISNFTLKTHIYMIYAKLGLTSREKQKSITTQHTKAVLFFLKEIGALNQNWEIKQ